METNFFVKSHGLGNCYIVIDSDKIDFELTDERVIRICDLHFGVGSNGILLKVPSKIADFGLKIYKELVYVNIYMNQKVYKKFH